VHKPYPVMVWCFVIGASGLRIFYVYEYPELQQLVLLRSIVQIRQMPTGKIEVTGPQEQARPPVPHQIRTQSSEPLLPKNLSIIIGNNLFQNGEHFWRGVVLREKSPKIAGHQVRGGCAKKWVGLSQARSARARLPFSIPTVG
jgi:hypothetical protein